VAGVEEEERKRKKKKREGGVGLRPYLDLLAPSAADPRVVDLRAARVEPDHRSSVCGRALDLAGAPLLDLRQRRADARHLVGASERVEAPQRPLDGGAHTNEGLGRCLRLALSAAARRPLAAARERERGRGRMRLGFARGRRARFCSAGNLAQPSDLDGRLTLTRPSFSPDGMKLSRPRLRPGARDVPSASGPLG
jgi:hypothetical protein